MGVSLKLATNDCPANTMMCAESALTRNFPIPSWPGSRQVIILLRDERALCYTQLQQNLNRGAKMFKATQFHFFHSAPAGGLTSTFSFFTSSQFVLSVVPPLSWKLFIMARLVSSSASAKIF